MAFRLTHPAPKAAPQERQRKTHLMRNANETWCGRDRSGGHGFSGKQHAPPAIATGSPTCEVCRPHYRGDAARAQPALPLVETFEPDPDPLPW